MNKKCGYVKSKEYDEGFVEGYKIGMNTAFDFMIGYCNDYKDEISSKYRALENKLGVEGK